MKRVGLYIAITIGLIGALFVLNSPGVQAADAEDFTPGHLIDNSVIQDKNSMGVSAIQNFLNKKLSEVGGCDTHGEESHSYYYNSSTGRVNNSNDTWVTTTRAKYGERVYEWRKKNGLSDLGSRAPYTCLKDFKQNDKSAARIIREAGQDYNVNPQFFVVLLQKEQSLVKDDWPWKVQYKFATGFNCPDDDDGCRSGSAGFTSQIRGAANMVNKIMTEDPNWTNWYPPGKNDILYNPDTSCGSDEVNIKNLGTSVLYNYTPYQPNKAALDNLYGTGNGCSAYGNRNFWRDFTDWFGSPTPSKDIVLLRNPDNGKIFVIDKNKNTKVHIATIDAYKAWGFNKLGATNVDSSVLDSYDNGGSLRRLAYERGTGKAYFVDDQTAYHIPNHNMAKIWDFSLDGIPWLPQKAVRYSTLDRLTPRVKSPVGPKIYMMDSGTLRHYPSPTVLSAWEVNGRSTKISETHFCKGSTGGDSCDFRWAEGDRLGFPKASSPETGKIYFINSGNKHWLSSLDIHAVYNGGSSSTISQPSLNRFFDAPNATALISETYDNKIFLLDDGKRRHIGHPTILKHWRPDSNSRITEVSAAFLKLLDKDSAITSFTATDGTNSFYMKRKKYQLEDSLKPAFLSAKNPVSATAALLNLYSTRNGVGTPFVTSQATSKVFFLNGAGTKHHVGSLFDLRIMRSGTGLSTLSLPHRLLKNIDGGTRTSYQFKVDGGTYVFDDGAYHKVVSDEWNLDPSFTLDAPSLEWFTEDDNLTDAFRAGSDYGLVRNGITYTSGNEVLGSLWGISDSATNIDSRLASRFPQKNLSPFVGSQDSNNSRIYIYDGAALYHVPTIGALRNLGPGRFGGRVSLSEAKIASQESPDKATYLLDDTSGIVDGGKRRHFRNDQTATDWGAAATSQYAQVLIDLFAQKTNSTAVSRLITSNETSKYYCMEDGQKRWVTSFDALDSSNCKNDPLRGVSHNLLKQIPRGDNL